MTTLASWSGDGLSADTTWTGELGTGDTTTPTVTITGSSTAATQSTTVPPGTRNTGMTLKFHQQINYLGYGKWTRSGGAIAQNSGRVYYRTNAHTGTGHAYPLTWYNGTTQVARLRWDGAVNAVDMVLRLYQSSGAGTLLDTSTVALVVSTWYRIEWQMDSSRNIELRFYDVASSETTPVSGLTLTGTLDADIDNIRLGTSAYASVQQPDTYWDDLLWTDTAEWLGAYGVVNGSITTTAPALGVVASEGTTAEGFTSGDNGATTSAPVLAAAASATAKVTGYVTTTAPAVVLEAPLPYLGAQTLASGASYHDGIGDSTSRTFNLFAPLGTAPPSGWPLVFYVHGGSFHGGSRNSLPARTLNHLIALGHAVASIDYELTDFNVISNTNYGATHPEPVSDALCALKYVVDTYDINPFRVVVFGASAGGHIALEAALTRNDSHPYTWGFTRSGLRQDADPQTNPTFRFDQGSRTGLPDILGVFLVAGVVNAEWIYTNGWGDSLFTTESGPASLAVRVYGGNLPNNSYNVATAAGELNLDSLITGAVGTVYDGYSHAPDFPIAYVEATADLTVPADAGITPLTAALDAMSYDTSTAVDVVNTVGGLTHFQSSATNADEHDEVELHFDLQQLTDWLDMLSSDNSITTTAPAVGLVTGTTAAHVSDGIVTTAPALGLTAPPPLWLQVDDAVTTTAPVLGATIPTPVLHVGVNKAITAPRLTVTPGASIGEGGVVAAPTAPRLTTGVGVPGVKIGKNVTTTAPRLTAAVGTAGTTIGKIAYPIPPSVTVTAGASTARTNKSVTTTAPALALGPGTSTGAAGRQVTVSAPAFAAAVAVAFTISRGTTKVTTAPGVLVSVPTAQAASSTASPLVFTSHRHRRPDFTRSGRRESTE